MSNCIGCNGYNTGLGDYCPACLVASRQIEREADVPQVKADVPQKQAMSHTNRAMSHLNGLMSHNVPHRPCSICKANNRAAWSHSYCRACYATKRKESRHSI